MRDGDKVFVMSKGIIIKQLQIADHPHGLVVSFKRITVFSMLTNTNNEHMESEVIFDIMRLTEPIENFRHFTARVRQPAGESFSYEASPLEVEIPQALVGIVDYSDYRAAVEEVYRATFGRNGDMIKITEKATDASIKDVFFERPYVAIINGRQTAGHGGW